ncbi:MAG: sulfhydrogenase subunit delta, partial [Methylococcales bacterium]|nr:sulfhydrogenase subunit delta [Methylococcales bacterium]
MITFENTQPTLAIHKFTSCDGCQLSLLNLGPDLLQLSKLVNIQHFVEAGIVSPDCNVDIALIEGSISTNAEIERIRAIRAQSHYIVALGACATAGGIQALRNMADGDAWLADIYPNTEALDSLTTSQPIADYIRVDFELRGCPVNEKQITQFLLQLAQGVKPKTVDQPVCLTCKQKNIACLMITKKIPCMGPVTQTGCDALCPSHQRGCFACYGPIEQANIDSLTEHFKHLGISAKA